SRDTIKFGEGLNKEDVRLSISGRDLLVNFEGNEVDQLVLKDFMNNNTINNFEFADGSKFNRNNFMSLDTIETSEGNDSYSLYDGAEEVYAGSGDDSISGNGGDDILHGESGDDTLRGGNNNDTLDGGEGNDTLHGDNHNDSLDGGLGDDVLYGGSQSDTLMGGEGNDTLYGDNIVTSNTNFDWDRYYESRDRRGNDVLAGGKGDDFLAGGYGSDTYIFNKGDGVDTIQEMLMSDYSVRYYDSGSRDTIKFGEGISSQDLNFNYDGNDVHVTFNRSDTDKLILKNFQNSTLETFEFADGSRLSKSDIKIGSSSDDTLVGNNNTNIISGNEGADTLISGSGDDVLEGGAGADTYVIDANDTGTKTIKMSSNDDSIDTIRLDGINSSDVEFEAVDDDLAILLRGNSGDLISKVIVDNFYDEANEHTDNIQIETADAITDIPNFGEQMRQLKAMMEAEEAANDFDGGAISGSQVTTQVGNSELLDIWAPKSESA
ncbi:calcium-binding protein, partial [Francisella tularensis]|uniref:calcium-binding protein n=1 Tax=Francisella tularensis TaxID=263 RepID=UPI0022783FA2